MAQINQYCSKNIASTSDAKNARIASDSLLMEYGNKSVELKIMQDLTNMYQTNFLEKQKILEEEKQKLEKLNDQVWSMEDSLCNQIWQFSKEHDFSFIFKQLAAISMPIHDDKIIPDNENKVRRRKNDSASENLKIKKRRGNQNESSAKNKLYSKNSKPNRKVTIAASNNYAELPIERSIIFTAEIDKSQLTNAFVKLTNIETEKFKTFTPKNRSAISIKFEQGRKHK